MRARSSRHFSSRSATFAPAIPYRTHESQSGLLAHTFFHQPTSTWQYIVADPDTKAAVIIDPVLDFEASTSHATTATADSLMEYIDQCKYRVEHILETHAHADHLTAAQYLKEHLNVPVGIGAGILAVQERVAQDYDIPAAELKDVFDNLWQDGDLIRIGQKEVTVMHLPGHTPDHIGYRCDSFVFVGDSLFLPDVGSARADFPGGSVSDLYKSAQKLLALPDHVRIFSGHDYPGEDRHYSCSSTVAEQRERNKHLGHQTDEASFTAMRSTRDSKLSAPKLIHQSLQINVRGGHLPKASASGHRLLKLPINLNRRKKA